MTFGCDLFAMLARSTSKKSVGVGERERKESGELGGLMLRCSGGGDGDKEGRLERSLSVSGSAMLAGRCAAGAVRCGSNLLIHTDNNSNDMTQ